MIEKLFKPGDRIRVLVDNANGANVYAGSEFTIERLEKEFGPYNDGGQPGVRVLPEAGFSWWFSFDNIELVSNQDESSEEDDDFHGVWVVFVENNSGPVVHRIYSGQDELAASEDTRNFGYAMRFVPYGEDPYEYVG